MDIGGTLTKLVYFTKSSSNRKNSSRKTTGGGGGGKLHFQDFQTENFKNEAMKFMIKLIQNQLINLI